MSIYHKITTNEEFVINITAAQPRAVEGTTSVDQNAFELMFDPLDASGNIIAWNTLYGTYPNRNFQINAQSNPQLDRFPTITYLQAGTNQRQDGSAEGIFSLDVTTLVSTSDTVRQIAETFDTFVSTGDGVDTLIRTSRTSVSASNDHFFRLKDGIRIHRSGDSIYVEDTVNSSPRVTWELSY